MEKKKIIIIGAGIAGMSAGIYGLDNDYDVTIYEKHNIVGGQCTGWVRDKVYIDGCAHWIVGTNVESDLYPLWRHVNAFNENTLIYETEYFSKYEIDGKTITFYVDLEKLEEELLKVSIEDKKLIHTFIKGIKAYQNVKIPVDKPLDCMNIFELTEFGIHMLPMLYYYIKCRKTNMKDFINKIKSPTLKKLFLRIINENYNIQALTYVMQALSKKDAGMVEGGSLKLANNMKKEFIKKGGKVFTNKEVDHVIIENNKAIGVCFKDNSVEYASYIISTTDAYHTMNDLLLNKYHDSFFKEKFTNRKNNPLSTSIMLSYKVSKNLTAYPKMLNFEITPFKINNLVIDNIQVRNYFFDKTINKDANTLIVLLNTTDDIYDYLKNMDKASYIKEKERIGQIVKKEIIKRFALYDNEISLIDVATPLTYNRYTNAYRGSYMSFITTNKSKGLIKKNVIKGLKNFVLAGQWLMPPGGLPIALFTGKHAIYRITKLDKKKFINLDAKYKVKNLVSIKAN